MEQDYKYMVRVSCMTYNHAPYIVDAMNGFTMQETNFPFVCTIVDDASTDGEPEIIRKYLHDNFNLEDKNVVRNEETDDYVLCFARHKTNPNCFFAVLWLKYNHYSIKKPKLPYIAEWNDNAKYIAMCEGDDYWIDPRKLQIQVDLLEAHPDVSLVAGGYIYKRGGKETPVVIKRSNQDIFRFSMDDWKKKWYAKTLVTVFRREADIEFNEMSSKFKYGRDVHRYYFLLKWGDGIYVPQLLGVYNAHSGGICSSNSREKNAIIAYNCHKELYEYEGGETLRYLLIGNIYLRLRLGKKAGNRNELLKEGLQLATGTREEFMIFLSYIKGLLK